jgi:hypothetical protein
MSENKNLKTRCQGIIDLSAYSRGTNPSLVVGDAQAALKDCLYTIERLEREKNAVLKNSMDLIEHERKARQADRYDNHMRALEAENAKQHEDEMATERDKLKAEIERLVSEITRKRYALDEQRNTIERLKRSLCTQAIVSYQDGLNKGKEERDRLKAEHAVLQKRIDNLQPDDMTLEKFIDALKADNVELVNYAQEKLSENEKLKAELAEAREKLETLERYIQTGRGRRAGLERTIDSMNIKFDEKDAEIERLKHACRTRPDYNLRCQRCGAPHWFDTSVPSEAWNKVIGDRYSLLCLLCIDDLFREAGETCEVEFYFSGEGKHGIRSKLYKESIGDIQHALAEQREKVLAEIEAFVENSGVSFGESMCSTPIDYIRKLEARLCAVLEPAREEGRNDPR